MNLDKIETLIASLAKTGDRDTILTICELLTEVSKFKKNSATTSTKAVNEVVKMEPKSHAALILEGIQDNYVKLDDSKTVTDSNNNSNMMNHAALLF